MPSLSAPACFTPCVLLHPYCPAHPPPPPPRRGPSWNRPDLDVTMPELLHESSPWLRLIMIFRDPVDRYFSAFYYYR